MRKAILIGVVVVAVLVILWAIFGTDGRDQVEEPEQEAIETHVKPPPLDPEPREPLPAQPEEDEVPVLVLPPLEDSDAFVREQVEPLELPESWIEQGDYIRRLAVLVENASRGEYPRGQLGHLAPREPFKVIERDDELVVDPASYRRYDRIVEQLERIEPEQLGSVLQVMNPLVEQAVQELGVEGESGELVAEAMRQVLAVPVVEGDVPLVQPNVVYQFADPELEGLTPLQKQVLRMGPDNVKRLQEYVRELAAAMNLPV